MEIPKEKLLEIYERMATIRQFEERVREEFAANRIPGFVHLYAGEEAVAVGVCAHLSDDDMITSTHRGHGHCIAKGVDVKAMMAELYGRATGACKGKGGSMHIADLDRGMLGANGIVGGGIPLACGAALSAQVLGKDNVAVSFFGDGGANEGSFHEGLESSRCLATSRYLCGGEQRLGGIHEQRLFRRGRRYCRACASLRHTGRGC